MSRLPRRSSSCVSGPLGTLLATAALAAAPAHAGPVLYEEHFTFEPLPTMLPLPAPWVSVSPNQWIEAGWLHNQDRDGGIRDAQAVLHDGDPSWSDYRLDITAEVLGPWTIATVLLRTQGYRRSSDGMDGRAYELVFSDYTGHGPDFGPVDRVELLRYDCVANACTMQSLVDQPFALSAAGPFDIAATLVGGRIQVAVDGAPVFDITDPNPILYGGIGVHNIWESQTRFDDVRVTAMVPEATVWATMAAGLALLALGAFTRRRRAGPGVDCSAGSRVPA